MSTNQTKPATHRKIEYSFAFEDRKPWNYILEFDESHTLIPKDQSAAKDWTKLEFEKCSNCPLSNEEHKQCPVARNLDDIVEDSKDTISCKQAKITVRTEERTIFNECGTQDGLRSLFGVVMASSGCPHLDWFKPLARFHLPFADTDETLFRVLAMELLYQYFDKNEEKGQSVAESIQIKYGEIQKVNHAFIERIRSYCNADADKNALASLDVFAQMFEFHQMSEFSSLRPYFE